MKALAEAGADVHCKKEFGYGHGIGWLARASIPTVPGRQAWLSSVRAGTGVCLRCRWTALHWAAKEGHTETTKALVAADADVLAKDDDGYCGALIDTACECAVRRMWPGEGSARRCRLSAGCICIAGGPRCTGPRTMGTRRR